MKCELNNSCYETAKDGIYIEYDWNTENNLEAEFDVNYSYKGDDIEVSVCEGCRSDIEFNCDFDEDYEWFSEERIREPTRSYEGRKSGKNYLIQKPWTVKERTKWIKGWHKKYPHLCDGDKNTFPYKCTEKCFE